MSSDANQSLDAFYDGELPAADAAHVAATLTPVDQRYLADIQALADRLRAAPLPAAGIGAQARWLNQWQVTRDRSVRRLAGWMTAAAAVVLAALLSTGFSGPAQAQSMLAEWETAAVAGIDDEEAPRAARVIAMDLSLTAEGLR